MPISGYLLGITKQRKIFHFSYWHSTFSVFPQSACCTPAYCKFAGEIKIATY